MSPIPHALDPRWVRDPAAWAHLVERVVAPAWHWIADGVALPEGTVSPYTLLPGCLDEPMLLVRRDGALTALPNVCSHRANRLVDTQEVRSQLRCGYHGRRFDLAGRCLASPGFAALAPEDDLAPLGVLELGPMVFASLEAGSPPWAPEVAQRLAGLPLSAARPIGGRVFDLDAPFVAWAENYLEGLHIPFVHPGLARALDLTQYRVVTTDWGVVQVGIGAPGEPTVPLPADHPDRKTPDEPIAGYYLWIHPTTAINVYPWGVSLNVLQPIDRGRSRVVYRFYVWDPVLAAAAGVSAEGTAAGQGAGADLYAVEAEDDAVVERVAAGLRSRSYRPGRLAPGPEDGVRSFGDWVRARVG